MGQSLKQRFNGSSQEVLDYARQFGIWKAMEQYEVKDYIAMLNFLQGMAPEESFEGEGADYDTFAGPQAFDGLVAATQRVQFNRGCFQVIECLMGGRTPQTGGAR